MALSLFLRRLIVFVRGSSVIWRVRVCRTASKKQHKGVWGLADEDEPLGDQSSKTVVCHEMSGSNTVKMGVS